MTTTDWLYIDKICKLHFSGDLLTTHNAEVKSLIHSPPVVFSETPLVTVRRTAWRKALREMEWFLSGNPTCPLELADTWWKGQLNPNGKYWGGYGQQLRTWNFSGYDQIEALINGLIHRPNSRRHIITTWHPEDMARITELNNNPNTPTTCHNTITQLFVRHGKLHLNTYQRSADILLGVPHNWIQTWAMLMWLATRVKLEVGSVCWVFGDLHLYQHPTHIQTAEQLIGVETSDRYPNPFELRYHPTCREFLAEDFKMAGDVPEPFVHTKPALL